MPNDFFWNIVGIGISLFLLLLPFALSDKWKAEKKDNNR